MPDPFFTSSKSRKRKRSATSGDAGPTRIAKRVARKGPHQHSTKGKLRGDKIPSGVSKTKVNGIREKGKKTRADEELESDRTDDEGGGDIEDMELRALTDDDEGASGEEDTTETPAEKRLRLAKLYLESIKEGLAEGEFDAAEIDKELISSRLRQDVMEHSGKVHLFIAHTFDFGRPPAAVLRTRGHRLPVTCAVASDDTKYLFTAGKDGHIIHWDLATGKRLSTFYKRKPQQTGQTNASSKGKGKGKDKAYGQDIDGHTDEVLALALSADGKYLVSGGRDRKVGVWGVENGEWVKGLSGHRDTVSALAFRKGTQQLYSGSLDRSIKLFDLSVLGYVDTLFGHQDPILSLDALRGETAVSAGGRDRTVRYWKIPEETQLVFRGGGRSAVRELLDGGALEGIEAEGEDENAVHLNGAEKSRKNRPKDVIEGSIECVAMIDETTFVSGGDSGSLCLWTTQKKKPIFKQGLAHGFNEVHSETEGLIQTPRWVTAVASHRYSDIFSSGSWEGDIRIWKLDSQLKSFSLAGTVPAPGVINSLQFLSPPPPFIKEASWVLSSEQHTTGEEDGSKSQKQSPLSTKDHSLLLVAGIGQEHRLGRWIKLKGDGVVNCALVIAFASRTPSID